MQANQSNVNSLALCQNFTDNDIFKADVLAGLSKERKAIPSKYFYDRRGSALFAKLTRHPDYYLTRVELAILNTFKLQLSALFSTKKFNLIELGPGEGKKSEILMQQFSADGLDFCYSPVDISLAYLNKLTLRLFHDMPALSLSPICADYFDAASWLQSDSKQRNIILFLGSSIGNFDQSTTHLFLQNLWQNLKSDDYLLIGFDLRKDIEVLIRAYNDSSGLTRAFNFNLLQRMNRELGANFVLEQFQHYPTYNVYTGAMESYLVSLKKQRVAIQALNTCFDFQPYEPIHLEYSWKYRFMDIEQLAQKNGFEVLQNFTDQRDYFVDSLWRVKK